MMYYLINRLPQTSDPSEISNMYAIVSPENTICSYWDSSLIKVLKSANRVIGTEERLKEFVNTYTLVASAPTIPEILAQVPELLL